MHYLNRPRDVYEDIYYHTSNGYLCEVGFREIFASSQRYEAGTNLFILRTPDPISGTRIITFPTRAVSSPAANLTTAPSGLSLKV